MFNINIKNAISLSIPVAIATLTLHSTNTAAQDQQDNPGSGLSYDYAELRFVDREFDNNGADGDGFLVGGSYEIAPKLLVLSLIHI